VKVRFDSEADALYVRLDSSPVAESEEVRPDFVLDLDARGAVVGIEILRVGHWIPGADLTHVDFEAN